MLRTSLPLVHQSFFQQGSGIFGGEWLGEQHACYLVEAAALSVLRVNAELRVTSPEEGARHRHAHTGLGFREETGHSHCSARILCPLTQQLVMGGRSSWPLQHFL